VDAGTPARVFDAGAPAPSARRCATPQGFERAPQTIAEVVGVLNALPKPTSLACFVESLPRPLEVYLTSSAFSAQPAVSDQSPRIFIIKEPLFLAFVPEGVAEGLLEIGWRTSPDRAIRTEIVFPAREPVTAEILSDHIALTEQNSFCGNCHFGEAPAHDAFLGDRALESDVNEPNPAYEVDLEWLRERALACEPSTSPRCELLEALFGHGEVRASRAFERRGSQRVTRRRSRHAARLRSSGDAPHQRTGSLTTVDGLDVAGSRLPSRERPGRSSPATSCRKRAWLVNAVRARGGRGEPSPQGTGAAPSRASTAPSPGSVGDAPM
jgi:hypothetical protein